MSSNRTRNVNRKPRSKTKKHGGGGSNPQHFPLTRVPTAKSKDYPVPPELDTTLQWYVNFLLTNVGQSYAAVRFYTNAAFSPDIVTPSNKPNGFTALAALYGSYRVIGYEYKISMVSRETFGFVALVRNTNTDPGTAAGQLAYTGEALSLTKQLNSPGGPPTVIRGYHDITQVTGRPVENDDLLAADVTTIPADQTFLGLFLQSLDTLTAAGVNCSVTFFMKVRFFNRKLLNDASEKAKFPLIYNSGAQGTEVRTLRN